MNAKLILAGCCVLAFSAAVTSQVGVVADPVSIRAAARAAGLGALNEVPVPVPDLAALGVLNPGNANARRDLIRLGKALFWDQQIGSDGQACASCHFDAGADSRAKNQLSPDLRRSIAVPPRDASNPDPDNVANADNVFGNSGVPGVPGFTQFGPNYTLTAADFPFHLLADPEVNNFGQRTRLRDTNDVVSSQGSFNGKFGKVTGQPFDVVKPEPDGTFNVGGTNTRRVEPRNTPTFINAVFNFTNFWDGRAHNSFNGITVVGPLDTKATILVNTTSGLTEQTFACENCSLASQAVGPPLSDLEMSAAGRFFAAVGRKVLARAPLRLQLVHPQDSVLGPLAKATLSGNSVTGTPGLATTYEALVKAAFHPKYWNSATTITFNSDGSRNIGGTSSDPNQVFSQMEVNFPLFFGIAVQMYEATQVSGDTPFDRFMAGNNAALSAEQLQGLLVFINQALRPDGNPAEVSAAIAAFERANRGSLKVGAGNCVSCHGGAEFTDASVRSVADEGPIEIEETATLMRGLLRLSEVESFLDNGFSNIGVRPTNEDLGRGGKELDFPLSFTRQALSNAPFSHPALPCTAGVDCPTRVQVDGAFKIPGLRNSELTGPYFHNGGQLTLAQVVEFYDRQGDFGDVNIADLDRNMVFINIDEPDEEPLVEFLLALTDNRVRNKMAPFDHPQLFVPNGHPGSQTAISCVDQAVLKQYNVKQACTDLREIPAVGRGGLPAAGLPPVGTFLGVPHVD
jgi:cytochrome c peroxidase